MSDVPEISLIVNTFEKPGHLAIVLESIAHQRGVAGMFEVIVTDDGSTDATRKIVDAFAADVAFRVDFTTAPHDGFQLARTRNRGAKLARGRTLLFLDGDCALPQDHLLAHLERRQPGKALLCYCARLDERESRSLDPAGLTPEAVRRLTPEAERQALASRHRKIAWHNLIRHATKPRLAGGNFSVWRNEFERVNGFDERFRGWGQEDDDLGLRLRRAGVRLQSVLDRTCSLHIWHPTDPSATKRWRDGPNVAYFHRRGRLTVCREGLVRRSLADLSWQLPDDLMASATGREIARIVDTRAGGSAGENGPESGRKPPWTEVDLVIRPGADRFEGRAECRLLVADAAWIEDGGRDARRLVRQADAVIPAGKPGEPPLARQFERIV